MTNSISKNILEKSYVHSDWIPILQVALSKLDKGYLKSLMKDDSWLPGINHLLSAFCIPLSKANYLLLGQSPYPRKESAKGIAFWDNTVISLWNMHGFSKKLNRAVSLRNWIKALLVARGDLLDDVTQNAIANIDKTGLVQTAEAFFQNLMAAGFILLNATLVFSQEKVRYHAKHWRPFLKNVLSPFTH